MNPAKTVSIHPYFKVNEGKIEEFKAMLPKFVEKTATEEACLFYDFTILDDAVVFCREAYVGADGALAHLGNVDELLKQALGISELIRLEIHGSADELAKLKEPLAELNPDWYEFQCGVEK